MKRNNTNNKSILDFGALSSEAQSYIRLAYKASKVKNMNWRGMLAVPPGSLFESVLIEFQNSTNISLEIPFTVLMHYIAAYLLVNDVIIKVKDDDIRPDFWTIVLAESGAGKTWTKKTISKALGAVLSEFPDGAASSAIFIQYLASKPKSLWVRDEFLQLLKQIEYSNGPLSELKDYLLRIYDNASISRETKKNSVIVESPALSILGFNTLRPFVDSIGGESIIDGFAQRFAYVIARKDPKRHYKDYAIWSVDSSSWGIKWQKLVSGIKPVYVADEEAQSAFVDSFRKLTQEEIDESFYRRIMWRAHKYALVYHIIRGQSHIEKITSEDYSWASRAIILQLADASDLLTMSSSSDLGNMIDKCEKMIIKMRSEGKEISPRMLLQRVKSLGNASTARFIFNILKEEKKL